MEAERGAGIVEHYDGNVCSQSWYRLRTYMGRLHEGSVVGNNALELVNRDRGLSRPGYGQSTGERWARGQLSIRVLGLALVNHRDRGLSRLGNCCRMDCSV